jgi:hypothetical protein
LVENSDITKQIFFEAFFKGQSVKTDSDGNIVLPADSPVTSAQMNLYELVKNKVEEVSCGNPGAVTVIIKMLGYLKERNREHEISLYLNEMIDLCLTGEGVWLLFKECNNDIEEFFAQLEAQIHLSDEEEE